MKIDILTLFPNMFDGFLTESIIKRAIKDKLVEINIKNIRDYSKDKHKKVDDTPYGGGAGMVLMCQPIYDAVKELKDVNSKVILMTPQGIKHNQKLAYNLSKEEHLIIVCGHYEGFDERIRDICDMEISIGDYVLTGGELPSMILTDSVVRLIDGVIDSESHQKDSFNDDLLDYPQYTKPQEYNGKKVPEVLTSGNHKEINEWRKNESVKRTQERRPDLLNEKPIYSLIKDEENKQAYILKDSIHGYNLKPKNNAKRTDVINVTKKVIVEKKFVQRIAKKNIEKKLEQLLKRIILLDETDDDNDVLILDETNRIKKFVFNAYQKYLEEEYKETVERRLEFIEYQIKVRQFMKNQTQEVEKEGKSR